MTGRVGRVAGKRILVTGALGAALADRCFELGWIAPVHDTRALRISPEGEAGFAAMFDIDVAALRREEDAGSRI